MKRILVILCSLILCGSQQLSAQQQPIFSSYLLNPFFYNPAVSGSENIHRLNVNYRDQWSGFEGAPKTFSASMYGSLKDRQKHGYGLMIVSDKIGLTARTGVYANYSYGIKLNKKTSLRLGISPGFLQYRVRLYDVRVFDGGDELLTGNILSENALDINAGFHLHNEKFFFGGSFSHVLGKTASFTTFNDQLRLHYNLMGGYEFKLNKKFDLQPIVVARYTQSAPVQADLTLRWVYMKNIWLSTSYRTSDAVSLGLGYIVKDRLWIGYTYDYTLTSIRAYQSGSHEIGISYALTKKKPTLDDKDEELNNSIMDKFKKKKESEEQ